MELSPGMQQYMKIKQQHPDCIVLFRMGDFYETFYEDAKTVSRELDIVLTRRGKGEKQAPLAGIPFHALDNYLGKLIRKGHRVAIVEQVEDPKLAKGLVKRDLVRIVTPGTIIESSMLQDSQNNYIACINKERNIIALAAADLSTGEFLTAELNDVQQLKSELGMLAPAELIIPVSLENSEFIASLKGAAIMTSFDDRHFWHEGAWNTLVTHFNVIDTAGFGIERNSPCITTAGALLKYLQETQKTNLGYINKLRKHVTSSFMSLDAATIRNLELLRNSRDGSARATLLEVLDHTVTPMGSRLLKKWIVQPLLDKEKIEQRLEAVDELAKRSLLRDEMQQLLKGMNDIERIISRINFGNANARDLLALKKSLEEVPALKSVLETMNAELLEELSMMQDCMPVVNLIEKAIAEEPPVSLREGNLIKPGFNQELDELRSIAHSGKSWIAQLEAKEKNRTGIKSLKISYNKVFGYYIEITRPNLHLVPPDYMRKQTQVNAERFITPELKEQEDKVLQAEERMIELEYALFMEVSREISKYTEAIQEIAQQVAVLDCLQSFAGIAADCNYAKPEISISFELLLQESRHPVLEKLSDFVANDCMLDEYAFMYIITGPNMAGKSTYMRQVALIVLMAQIGSFVPAAYAKIPIVDKLFTRVGAFDDMSHGQSTFMLEMVETAAILNTATKHSLVIIDELGRGTSTYDGIALAWAIVENIHDTIGAKTLFATHYHQLNKLAEKLQGIRNFSIAVKEEKDEIVFLHKIVAGGTDRSYGIQVAKLAGIPQDVIERSKAIMDRLEMEDEIAGRIHDELKHPGKAQKNKVNPKISQKTLSGLYHE
ncbi:DNA mismatch repair protein MutS [Candidatus Woesearchaeota archaeon]|nr:DNA mismatch repair protein MutS [Candidatus Woesearchaeota archaeon]